MLTYGCTRLEIGVQSTYEDVARDTNRGHTVAAVADCFCLAKDAGFKVGNIPLSLVEVIWDLFFYVRQIFVHLTATKFVLSLMLITFVFHTDYFNVFVLGCCTHDA